MLFGALRSATLIVVALAMVPAVAHALELPGKLRLTRDQYTTTQRIYYPGFTIAGIAEPGSIILTAIVLALTPRGADFWLALVALLGVVGMQLVYWLVTHPVNQFWVEGRELGGVGRGFFALAAGGGPGAARGGGPAWTALRDRWEYSHVVRAALAAVSLVALAIALA